MQAITTAEQLCALAERSARAQQLDTARLLFGKALDMAPADEQLLRASIRLGRAGLCLMADLAEDALEDASAAWAAVQREAAVVPADQAEVLALLDTMSNSALSRMAHAKAALGRRAALADLAALPAAFKCGAGGAEAAWHLVMQSFDPADGGKEASQDVEDVDVDMVAVTRCARLLSEVVEEASAPIPTRAGHSRCWTTPSPRVRPASARCAHCCCSRAPPRSIERSETRRPMRTCRLRCS